MSKAFEKWTKWFWWTAGSIYIIGTALALFLEAETVFNTFTSVISVIVYNFLSVALVGSVLYAILSLPILLLIKRKHSRSHSSQD
ncbi:hypothetical protein [Kangiella aquimarina]|uniref:Uncharacterized protein n=1 Tax=Kangiella aquimarina TaxID=261965 RepID=A0ABZ0X3F4_9GAMM|nr:hypothetical protein [Kangiella aquimarina]WQG85132.1 hypothetical protein SR900_11740 [Kangiella aquimarina]